MDKLFKSINKFLSGLLAVSSLNFRRVFKHDFRFLSLFRRIYCIVFPSSLIGSALDLNDGFLFLKTYHYFDPKKLVHEHYYFCATEPREFPMLLFKYWRNWHLYLNNPLKVPYLPSDQSRMSFYKYYHHLIEDSHSNSKYYLDSETM